MKEGNTPKDRIRSFSIINKLALEVVSSGQSAQIRLNEQERALFSILHQLHIISYNYNKHAHDNNSQGKGIGQYQKSFSKLMHDICLAFSTKKLNEKYSYDLIFLAFNKLYSNPIFDDYFIFKENNRYDEARLTTINKFTYIAALQFYKNANDLEQCLENLKQIVLYRVQLFSELLSLETRTPIQNKALITNQLVFKLIGNRLLDFLGSYKPKLSITSFEKVKFISNANNFLIKNMVQLTKTFCDYLYILSCPDAKACERNEAVRNYSSIKSAFYSLDRFICSLMNNDEKFRENEFYAQKLACLNELDSNVLEKDLNEKINALLKEDKSLEVLQKESQELSIKLNKTHQHVKVQFVLFRNEKEEGIRSAEFKKEKVMALKKEISNFKQESDRIKKETNDLVKQIRVSKKKLKSLSQKSKATQDKKIIEKEKLEKKVCVKERQNNVLYDKMVLKARKLDEQLVILQSQIMETKCLLSKIEVEINTKAVEADKTKDLVSKYGSRLKEEQSLNGCLRKQQEGQERKLNKLSEETKIKKRKVYQGNQRLEQDSVEVSVENQMVSRQINELTRTISKIEISPQFKTFVETQSRYRIEMDKVNQDRNRWASENNKLLSKIKDLNQDISQTARQFMEFNPSQVLTKNGSVIKNENIYMICQTNPLRMAQILGEILSNKRGLNDEHLNAIKCNINRIHRLPLDTYLSALELVFKSLANEKSADILFKHEKIMMGLFPFAKLYSNEMKILKQDIVMSVLRANLDLRHCQQRKLKYAKRYLSIVLVKLGKLKYKHFTFDELFSKMCEDFDRKFKGQRRNFQDKDIKKETKMLLLNEFSIMYHQMSTKRSSNTYKI